MEGSRKQKEKVTVKGGREQKKGPEKMNREISQQKNHTYKEE